MKKGDLYLLPVPLGEQPYTQNIPASVAHIGHGLGYFIVENAKTARQILKSMGTDLPLQSLQLNELNQHTPSSALSVLLQPLLEGHDVGLLSDAGCPAVADPGAQIVALAHQHGIRVIPQVGPSSILLALMASGSNGQRFAFHGYLPIDAAQRQQKIKQLEQRSKQEDEAQIFIETPYRNQAFLDTLINACQPNTLLCSATDLTLNTEEIISRPIQAWRAQAQPNLHKRPTIFVLYAR